MENEAGHKGGWWRLALCVIFCEAAGGIGSLFTGPSLETWYKTLEKPSFNPPGWLFGPVWFTLYFLMGVSAFIVWRRGLGRKEVRIALLCFLVQLLLNAAWTPAFFGLHNILAAFVIIIFLWAAILVTILRFLKVSALAGILLFPYVAWVSFAAVLNGSILILNC